MIEKFPECSKSKVYSKFHLINEAKPRILITDNDTVSEIMRYKYTTNTKVCALNFASFTSPGGGFLSGCNAQEEGLCHYSNLYETLSLEKEFYSYNKQHTNSGAYENRAIYSPKVYFSKDEKETYCDIITCAAPNLNYYNNLESKWAGDDKSTQKPFDNSKLLKSRIEFVLDIAEDNEVDVLILGAWGCGVFRQDPKEVARYFKELLNNSKYNFRTVIFAIPPGKNHDVFKEVFKL